MGTEVEQTPSSLIWSSNRRCRSLLPTSKSRCGAKTEIKHILASADNNTLKKGSHYSQLACSIVPHEPLGPVHLAVVSTKDSTKTLMKGTPTDVGKKPDAVQVTCGHPPEPGLLLAKLDEVGLKDKKGQ